MSVVLEEINGRMLGSMLDFASVRLGAEQARALFEAAALKHGVSVQQAVDPRGWAGLDVFHSVCDALGPRLGEGFLADAVAWVVPIRRDFSAMSLTALTEPGLFYRHLDRARSFYAKHLRFEVSSLERGRARVKLSYREGVPRRRESCDVGRGVLCTLPVLFGLPAAEVVEQCCYAKGADACQYEVRWRSEPSLGLWGLALGTAAAGVGFLLVPGLGWAALPAVSGLVGREVRLSRLRAHTARVSAEQRQALEANEREFERRYHEIRSLNEQLELRVVERTAQLHSAMEELREGNAVMGEAIEDMKRLHAGVLEGPQRPRDRSVREFVHQMRNPMGYVLANLDYLEEATAGTSTQPVKDLAEVVRDAKLGVERMRGVLTWFLELQKAQQNAPAVYDADAEVRHLLQLCERDWNGAIAVHFEPGGAPKVPGLANQLNQVLLGLFNRARAVGRGHLWVSTRREGQAVVITARDDGPGLEPSQLESVFQPGVSGGQAPGGGLDLHLGRAIVARHGGALTVVSSPGQGTTFHVSLPLELDVPVGPSPLR